MVNYGVGITLTAGSLNLLARNKPNIFVSLSSYDNLGKKVNTKVSFASKAARKDWEEIGFKYIVEKDGFINIDIVGVETPSIKAQLNSFKKWSFNNKNLKDNNSKEEIADSSPIVNFVCYDCGPPSPPGGGGPGPGEDPGNYGGGSVFGNDPYYNDSPWSPTEINNGAAYPNGSDNNFSDDPMTCPLARQCRNVYRRIRDNNIKKAYIQYFTVGAGCIVATTETTGTVILSTSYLAAINPILPLVAGGLAGATVGLACVKAAASICKLDIDNANLQCELDIRNNCNCK